MNFPPLLSSLSGTFELLLQGSLRGTLMAGGVLALQAALGARLSPRWRYGLWLAVAAALLLPPITRPAIDVTPLREVPVVRYVMTPELAEPHAPSAPTAILPASNSKTSLSRMEIAAAVWLSGMLLVAAFWLTAHRLLMRRFRRAAFAVNPELLAEIKECAAIIGLRRMPQVLQAPAVPSPAVSGFLSGTLLLPADVETRFTGAERRFMLLHELAHLRRGDLLSNWVINALLALHWFNPVLWFAATRVRADRESACDATVLHHTGAADRGAYGYTLLKLHSEMQVSHRHPAFVGILERGGAIRQRIQHIASYGSGKKVWGTVAGITAAGLLSCIGVRLYAQPPAPAKPALERQISMLEKRLLARSLNAQQVELESKVFAIDPSVGKITVGALTLTPPPQGKELLTGPTVGLLQQEELDQLVERLSSLTGVQSLSTPRVTARHAQRAIIEITKTLRYASKWNAKGGGAAPEPTDFETKSVGLTLETETGVALQAKGERAVLDLNVTPQLVYFGGWKDVELAVEGTVEKPVFIENRKITTSLSIYDGQHVLLWWYMDLPDGVPWNYDPHLKAADLKTTRRTLLWVLSPRLLDARAPVEPEAFPAEYFQPRNWETKDASVEHLLMHFKEQSQAIDPQKRGLNLVLAKPAKEPPLVSLDLKNVSLIGALEHAFKAAGMRVEEQADNTLVITEEPR